MHLSFGMRFSVVQVLALSTCAVCLFQLCYGYQTFYLNDECQSNETIIYNMGTDSQNSSGILSASRKDSFLPSRDCVMILRPPMLHGVVISIKNIDFRPWNIPHCNNYIKIIQARGHPVTLCGYSNDATEYQSYSIRGEMKVIFHTGTAKESGPGARSQFNFTFTTYRKTLSECTGYGFRCKNNGCIWKDLTCDGHNNCGDLSDESRGGQANCGKLSTLAILAIVVGTIVISLIVIFIIAYVRRHKITVEIERLSGNNNSSSPTSCEASNPSVSNDLSSVTTTTRNSPFYRERYSPSPRAESISIAVGVARSVRFTEDTENLFDHFHLPAYIPRDPPPRYESLRRYESPRRYENPPRYESPPNYEP